MAKKPAGNQIIDPEKKKLFIEMRDLWDGLDKRAKSATGKRRQYEKEAKSAGFSAAMFKDSLQMETPEGEAEFKAEIANRLLAAAYSDADVGDQLSLFLDHDRTPAVDRAYKEGQTRAMENKSLQCSYAPETEQYRAFSEGYHAEQERQIKAGIKKLEPDAKANGKVAKKAAKPAKGAKRGPGRPPKAAAATPKDDAPPRRPAAAPATRASLAAEKAKGAEPSADSYFSKSTDTAGNA
jgi:hypothetical protein